MLRSGFSLVEAMVALAITAMAGSVLLLATEGVLKTTNDAVAQTVAQGMAAQLIDEVLGARYHAATGDPYETTLTASAYEKSGLGRERYDDTDDFNNYSATPPLDSYGVELGKGNDLGASRHPNFQSPGADLANWRQRVSVYYVNPNNPTQRLSGNNTSDYRAVEVTIERVERSGGIRPLAKLRRVYCYVPIP